jgi:hypothetical protein
MFILAMISFLVGAVLGLRFKVFILVPAIGLALAVAAVTGIGVGDGVWRLVGTMVVAATLLQLGYVGGSILRLVICAMYELARMETPRSRSDLQLCRGRQRNHEMRHVTALTAASAPPAPRRGTASPMATT